MTTKLCVAPEDVMALLDGELTGADARAVEEHLEECSQCALLAKQLRETSESLAQWTVPPMTQVIDDAVNEQAERESPRLRKRTGAMRFRPWGLATAAAVSAVLGVVAFVAMSNGPRRTHSALVYTPSTVSSADPSPASPTPPPQPQMATARANSPLEKKQRSRERSTGSVRGASSLNGALVEWGGLTEVSPMIARVSSLTLLVKDVDAARPDLEVIVARHHGFSARLSVNSPEYGAHNVAASLRVPAAELQATITELERLGRVTNESQSGEEVSQEHADLAARLKTARETEARFQAILQQRTGKISDVLEVEENIARVRGDIEAMEAQQKSLEQRVDFATIDVVLTQEYKAPLAPQADSVTTQVHNALVAGYHNTTGMLMGLVLITMEFGPPVLLFLFLISVPVYLLWRRYRRIHS